MQEARLISFVNPVGFHSGSCGYCAGVGSTSAAFYMISKSLSVDHYQILLDRGWRRSGNILYKPDLRHSCCPHYTIRLPVSDFKPRKDQRRAWNRWNRYVVGDEHIQESARLHPKAKTEKTRQRHEFDLIATVHEAENDRILRPPEPQHHFEVTLEPDSYSEEKFALYENYQEHVHHEPSSKITRDGFRRFLCSSPLLMTERTVNGVQQKLGGFHQCYRLDGRLIAMGVVDLLPHCVSGVYFVYHQDFEKWSFGKISALREVCLALEGGYEYYYMGYYIHSCPKMKYKNDYQQQYFLDMETLEWNPLDDEVRLLMDKHHYLSMSKVSNGLALEEVTAGGADVSDTAATESLVQGPTSGAGHTPVAKDTPSEDEALQAPGDSDHKQSIAVRSVEQMEHSIANGVSLFHLDFPGMMTVEDLHDQVDIDSIKINIPRGGVVVGSDLMRWEESSIFDMHDLKGIVATLAACVGPEFAKEMVVDMA